MFGENMLTTLYQVFGIITIILIIIISALELLFKWRRHPHMKMMKAIVTGKNYLPIIGHLRVFRGGPEIGFHRGVRYYNEYRDSNGFKVWLADGIIVFLMRPEDLSITLGSPNFTNKCYEYKVLQESVMGQGLFSTTNISEWRKNRRIITPAFHFQILKSFISNFYDEAKVLAEILAQKMDRDGQVEVHRYMGLCTLDMITKNAMGVSVNAQDDCNHLFVKGMETILEIWHERIAKPWLFSKTLFSLSSVKTRHDKAMNEIQNFATEVILKKIEERYTELTSDSPKGTQRSSNGTIDEPMVDTAVDDDNVYCSSKNSSAFLDLMIESMYDGIDKRYMNEIIQKHKELNSNRRSKTVGEVFWSSFINRLIAGDSKLKSTATKESVIDPNNNDDDDYQSNLHEKYVELEQINRQLRDEVVTIMIGGQETTACENSFTILMLALHPDVQEKVVVEMDEIFGDDPRSPTYEDLQKMKYLECVIKETMRLYPAIPLMVREAQQDTNLSEKGVTIPKGCRVGIFIFAIHRDPRWFPEPDQFIPDRFLPENSRARHPYSFLPFAAGARNCIGQKYAMLQMKVIASTFVRQFKILPSEKMPSMSSIVLEMTATLRSKTGVWVRLERRDEATSC